MSWLLWVCAVVCKTRLSTDVHCFFVRIKRGRAVQIVCFCRRHPFYLMLSSVSQKAFDHI